jgi:pyruvate dehydrogenase E1 component
MEWKLKEEIFLTLVKKKKKLILRNVSDYIRSFTDQIRPYTGKPFYSLGTDGFGRSDTRKQLRKFFEVDKEHIVAYALSALAKEQLMGSDSAEIAIKKYNIDKNKAFPTKL